MSSLRGFPEVIFRGTEALHRVHRERNHPAWFSCSGDWRFDPPPSHRTDYGVCYLGVDESAAYLEVFGRLRSVPQSHIDHRRLSQMVPARDLTVADLTDRSVVGDFGVTAAVSVGPDYAQSQRLSAGLFEAGYDGIRYRIRHDPSLELEGLAMFGEPDEQPGRFSSIKTDVVPEWLVDAMWVEYGIEVVPDAPLP